jgi:hypothetical protein
MLTRLLFTIYFTQLINLQSLSDIITKIVKFWNHNHGQNRVMLDPRDQVNVNDCSLGWTPSIVYLGCFDSYYYICRNVENFKNIYFSKTNILWMKIKNILEFFNNILFFNITCLKLINHLTNMCWSCPCTTMLEQIHGEQ